MRLSLLFASSFVLSACASAPSGAVQRAAQTPGLPAITLPSTDGTPREARTLVQGSRATVIEFFTPHCPVQSTHDARLRSLAFEYTAKGVAFWAVDSEAGATVDQDREEVAARKYPFPVLIDRDAHLADALGADFSTYTVVLDDKGKVAYRGGLDSDRTHLTDDAQAYVKDALDDVLAGRPVRTSEGKALGCALRKR
jgi:hypothetical protein